MAAVDAKSLPLYMPLQSRQQIPLNTIETCIFEAKRIVRQSQLMVGKQPNRKVRDAFRALAGGDPITGLLAFYLWQRRQRSWR